MRLFVSIDLPEELSPAVARVQDSFEDAAGLNLVDPTQAHVTLKFLGEVDEDRVDEIGDALEAAVADAAVGPFDATLSGLGVFPSLDYIRVVWLGVEGGGAEMTTLADAVESRLVDLGFDSEDHEFTPHITLGRLQHAGGKETVQEVVRGQEPTVGTMRVEEVRLTESELGPEGPEHSTIRSFPL